MPSSTTGSRIAPGGNRGNIRIAVLFAVALCLSAARPLHAGPVGPSVPDRRDGVSPGAGYFHSASKWKPVGGRFGAIDVSQPQAYLEWFDSSVRLSMEGGGFLRIGVAGFDDGTDFHAGMKPFGTLGIRDTWYGEDESGSFTVGTALQGSYFLAYEAEKTFLPGSPVVARIRNKWDITLGVPVGKRLTPRVLLYGGPMASYGAMQVTREGPAVHDSTDYRLDSNFGVFGGGKFSFGDRLTAGAELQFLGGFSAGVSLAYTF